MDQHIITRRVSKKNTAKEVVEYTVNGATRAKYVGNKGHTKEAFITLRKEALGAVAYDGGTVVVRDLRA